MDEINQGEQMRRKATILCVAIAIAVVGASPASAGSHGWTSVTNDFWHCCGTGGASEHGQHWDSSKNQMKAYHTKSGYEVGVQSRYRAYGVLYTTSTVWKDSVAVIHRGRIDEHNPKI